MDQSIFHHTAPNNATSSPKCSYGWKMTSIEQGICNTNLYTNYPQQALQNHWITGIWYLDSTAENSIRDYFTAKPPLQTSAPVKSCQHPIPLETQRMVYPSHYWKCWFRHHHNLVRWANASPTRDILKFQNTTSLPNKLEQMTLCLLQLSIRHTIFINT